MSEIKKVEMNAIDLKETFIQLGLHFERWVTQNPSMDKDFEDILSKAGQKNPWFTRKNCCLAFSAWAEALKADKIDFWLSNYHELMKRERIQKTIGVINAGNIPLVGFHDLMCVVMSGNSYIGKNASDDPFLLPFVSEKIIEIEPRLKDRIQFAEKLSGFDAVIATGSNNSARYFDYYFGKYPHIIRMNRNAVAVLKGDEQEDDFRKLGTDIFQYFGLGCRNVSKLFVPRKYDFKNFYEAIESFSDMMQHNKYMNNHDYNNAVYLLKKIPFLDNGFLILKEDEFIASPIAVLYFEYYDDIPSLAEKLQTNKEKIQCIVEKFPTSLEKYGLNTIVDFGNAQQPQLLDYADGIDTMKFLLKLK